MKMPHPSDFNHIPENLFNEGKRFEQLVLTNAYISMIMPTLRAPVLDNATVPQSLQAKAANTFAVLQSVANASAPPISSVVPDRRAAARVAVKPTAPGLR